MTNIDFNQSNSQRSRNARERLALAVSGGIILAAILFWAIQIKGVLELLKLAYG